MTTIESVPKILNDGKFRPKNFENWNKVRETMFVHTRGKHPNHILTARRPNEDPDVHGILMQLPLPAAIRGETTRLLEMIAPEKDVDGLTTTNMGRLMAGMDGLVPCTPQGALRLIKEVCPDLSGKHAVVLGRSLLFGKPMQQLLLNEDCTVTQVHSRSVDLPSYVRQADIVVAAVGRAEMVRGDWVKDGAIVIDVGINRMDDGKLKGDVAFDEVVSKASAITPVPGGVGPMTIACLLANTVKAASFL
ncbi:bifunctional methylenetetrahydrofolate dehydrogenase/methenyltetrahydrofolate cyclohydrolase [bacterium]|nr:bifunctional methylenetetrahydrofolate dehydrogenase/methenyltetrahydrofolate cyclohydrolase [bacterium]